MPQAARQPSRVLCEPHWFGGAVADLAAVRSAVAVPVLAKEFVVDPRQLPVLRAAGADLVLLIAVLHPARRLADLVRRAWDLGLEPLVEVHAERELDAALATGVRLVGVNSRDLGTLAVDPDGPIRLRERVPADRIAVAESGVRDVGTLRRWRAAGYDAALVGEALMRAADPRAAAAAFVAAGAVPDDPGAVARAPLVKICGIVDAAGIQAARAAGADAVGLNFVAGTPREITLAEGADLAHRARAGAATGHAPSVVAITANADGPLLAAIVRDVDPDVIQYAGGEPEERIAASPRPAWVVVHLPVTASPDGVAQATCLRRRPRPGASVPRRRCRADSPRHGRRAAPGRDRHARGPVRRGVRGARDPRHPGGRARPGQRRGRAAGRACRRGGRGVRGRTPAPPRRAAHQGSARRRAVRETCPRSPLRPTPRVPPGPRLPTPACSMSTRPVAGVWTGRSVADTSPRRS